MRLFVYGPRVNHLRFGIRLTEQTLRLMFPMWLWRLPILAILGVVSFAFFYLVFTAVRELT